MSQLDLTKPVQTRDGRPVRILAIDAKNEKFPVVGLVDNDGHESATMWTSEGGILSGVRNEYMDLVNVPEPNIELSLTLEEAATLTLILRTVCGDSVASPRGHAVNIQHKLNIDTHDLWEQSLSVWHNTDHRRFRPFSEIADNFDIFVERARQRAQCTSKS